MISSLRCVCIVIKYVDDYGGPYFKSWREQYPALLQLINDNQAEFLRLINEAGADYN